MMMERVDISVEWNHRKLTAEVQLKYIFTTLVSIEISLPGGGATFDVALVVMLLQQAAVASQFLVFVRMRQEVCPRGGTAAVLRQGPSRHKIKKTKTKRIV